MDTEFATRCIHLPEEKQLKDRYGAMTFPIYQTATFAHTHGEEWLEALLDYLRGNLDYLEKYIHDHLSGVRMVRPEGTFLVWLDLGDLGFTPAEQEQRIVGDTGLWLDSGRIFGKTGTGFERINIACPRSILEKAVKRLSFALM